MYTKRIFEMGNENCKFNHSEKHNDDIDDYIKDGCTYCYEKHKKYIDWKKEKKIVYENGNPHKVHMDFTLLMYYIWNCKNYRSSVELRSNMNILIDLIKTCPKNFRERKDYSYSFGVSALTLAIRRIDLALMGGRIMYVGEDNSDYKMKINELNRINKENNKREIYNWETALNCCTDRHTQQLMTYDLIMAFFPNESDNEIIHKTIQDCIIKERNSIKSSIDYCKKKQKEADDLVEIRRKNDENYIKAVEENTVAYEKGKKELNDLVALGYALMHDEDKTNTQKIEIQKDAEENRRKTEELHDQQIKLLRDTHEKEKVLMQTKIKNQTEFDKMNAEFKLKEARLEVLNKFINKYSTDDLIDRLINNFKSLDTSLESVGLEPFLEHNDIINNKNQIKYINSHKNTYSFYIASRQYLKQLLLMACVVGTDKAAASDTVVSYTIKILAKLAGNEIPILGWPTQLVEAVALKIEHARNLNILFKVCQKINKFNTLELDFLIDSISRQMAILIVDLKLSDNSSIKSNVSSKADSHLKNIILVCSLKEEERKGIEYANKVFDIFSSDIDESYTYKPTHLADKLLSLLFNDKYKADIQNQIK